MAKEYTVGAKYYLPVTVKSEIGTDCKYPIFLEFVDSEGRDTTDTICIADEPELLLTADEIIDMNIIQAQDNDKARYEEVKKRCERALNDIGELGTEIKTLKSENERLSKQNEELGAKVDDLETELNSARSVNEFAVETAQNKEKLITEQRELIKKYGMVIDILIDKIVALKKGENNG